MVTRAYSTKNSLKSWLPLWLPVLFEWCMNGLNLFLCQTWIAVKHKHENRTYHCVGLWYVFLCLWWHGWSIVPLSVVNRSLFIWSRAKILLKVSRHDIFHWSYLTRKDFNHFSHFPLSITNPVNFLVQTILDKIFGTKYYHRWLSQLFSSSYFHLPLLPPKQ